jgi:hypothetical protein
MPALFMKFWYMFGNGLAVGNAEATGMALRQRGVTGARRLDIGGMKRQAWLG